MVTEHDFMKFGFVKRDIDICLNKAENIFKLKEVYVEIYPDNPFNSSACFMLILRASEKNATASLGRDRIILKKNDINGTHIVNIMASKVVDCFYKYYPDCDYAEFILNIQNIYYKITVFN